jgi:Na+-translocating ferredoxin:NAD+ oxidoreductase RnfD subunit
MSVTLKKIDAKLETKIIGKHSLTGGEAVGLVVFLASVWFYKYKKQDVRIPIAGLIVMIVAMIAY